MCETTEILMAVIDPISAIAMAIGGLGAFFGGRGGGGGEGTATEQMDPAILASLLRALRFQELQQISGMS